ncbi:MAG: succinylglutamate-semialdehyde dehydrogenase [Oceanospirillaceae bacterium]|nr:succinylglutamate-semialdehyde dehydrogenase [Oceanospirillaceae bacterium]
MNEQLLIANQWIAGEGDELISVDPGRSSVLWHGRSASKEQVAMAVASARQAFLHWSELGSEPRIELCRHFARRLEENRARLAYALGEETGKPLWEADTEITAMIGKIEISIRSAQVRTGEHQAEHPRGHSVLRHRPHGVLAVFGPYNFPGHLPNGHIVPALLAGNTVVFKPSELTPRFAQLMVELWCDAGLPSGVINLVQGAVDTAKALAEQPGIDGALFTGSSQTGHSLHRQFAGQPEKILALEMGGNNPLILGQTSNLRAAVFETIQSAYLSAGQRCTCARRLLIPNTALGERFLDQLERALRHLKVGLFNDEPQPFMGCLISNSAASALLDAQSRLLELGGEAILRLERADDCGAMLSPGLIDVSAINALPDEEYFGPLLQVQRYDDFNQALALANATRYGLSAGLLSDQPDEYQQFQREIRAGIVNWNLALTGASSEAPFGGIKGSGNHRPSAWYAADYCAYPVSGLERETLAPPAKLPPGLTLETL